MVMIVAITFLTFANMVRQGIVLGIILEKVRPGRKPHHEYVEKLWS